MRKVTTPEIITIATGAEKHQAMTGNSTPMLGRLLQRFVHRIEIYEKAGYVITDRNVKKFSFTAKKQSE